jgi:hypothetical protein
MPQSIATLEMCDFGPGANVCAMLGGIHGVQNDQACVIDPAIRIFEAFGELAGLQRRAEGSLREVDRRRRHADHPPIRRPQKGKLPPRKRVAHPAQANRARGFLDRDKDQAERQDRRNDGDPENRGEVVRE